MSPHLLTRTRGLDLHPIIPFAPTLQNNRRPSASSVSAGPIRTWGNAERKRSLMETRPTARVASSVTSPTAKEGPSVRISNIPRDVTALATPRVTNVPDAAQNTTALLSALAVRRTKPVTPLLIDGWRTLMLKHSLVNKYPSVLSTLQHGAVIGVPHIEHSFTPPNKPSVAYYSTTFQTILQHEYATGRHLGPFTKAELEEAIGPFQTSPLSIIPKPNKPGKFRLVQDFSFPRTPASPIQSINARIDSSFYPCTWGTFSTMALCIARLPPGSQAAARDEAEAYRTMPLHPSQWNGTVVRIGDDAFNLDTCLAFGLAPSAGIYGACADAANDIMRAEGIGPIIKWVDDRVFFRVPKASLTNFNAARHHLHIQITQNGGRHHDGGRWWYHAGHLPDDRIIECDEDMSFPLKDFSSASPRSNHDANFTYCIDDINRIAADMGIPWEKSKDVPFGTVIRYIGLEWDIAHRTVSLPQDKREKYHAAITDWKSRATHTLTEVQSLHGKLLHACHVFPAGRAYLTRLEIFMGNFHDSPFQPRTPPKATHNDLEWWTARLLTPCIPRPIPGPFILHDHNAFSDASSGVGLGIVVGEHWRAWTLTGDWQSQGRDIGWAEAVAFELLACTLIVLYGPDYHFRCYGDNTGVVEGWWKGASKNAETNIVFRRLHDIVETTGAHFHTRYIPSQHNPADAPSRGILGPPNRILPAIPIPHPLRPYIRDATVTSAWPRDSHPPPKSHKQHRDGGQQAFVNRQLERIGEELLAGSAAWGDA
jgi:hypothetical protein